MPGDHLSESCRRLLKLGDDRRIQLINTDNLWIDYPQASRILKAIGNILAIKSKEQAPCMLVYGEPGSGKSSIIRRLKNSRDTKAQLVFMALNQNMPKLNARELIIDALGLPQRDGRAYRLNKDLIPHEMAEVIRLRGIKSLVIDEFNDALLVPRHEQLQTLSLLKGLSGEPYYLSVFCFGTPIARNALSYDQQLNRRFIKSELKDWTETEDFRSFLAGVEENLPLVNPSGLYGQELVSYLLSYTQGRMGGVMDLIKSAASYAIRGGQEKITIDLLDRARLDPMGY